MWYDAGNPEPLAHAQTGQGELRYRATTSDGRPLLEGRLSLAYPTDSTVAGTWEIRWSPDADMTFSVGPQVGTGTLVGTRRADALVLQLNPLKVDDNVSLHGIAREGAVRGEWVWSTIAGPYTSGRFSAQPD